LNDFIAINAPPGLLAAQTVYQQMLRTRAGTGGHSAGLAIRQEWCCADSFIRENGSGSNIASIKETGSWLAVVGTCFHQSGTTSANELLKLYSQANLDDFCLSLEGFFVIVVGDGRTRGITVITDIIGSCHFYVRQISGCTALSSSSLVLASIAEASLDFVACQEFLGMGVIYEDRSLYSEIKKLPPASVITYEDGAEVRRHTYWDPSHLNPESLTPAHATESLWHSLVLAASKVGNQFEAIACDLTGGYDSRAMAAAFLGAQRPFTAVVSGPAESPDVVISGGLAAKVGLRHLHFPLGGLPSLDNLRTATRLTDGEYDIVEYATIARIHHQLSQKFQISINGSFGEVARGYWWELLFPNVGARQPLDSQKISARRYAWNSSDDLFQASFQMPLVDHMASVVRRATEDLSGSPNTFQMDVAYIRMRMQRWQGRIASSTDKLWPCLSPFMFRSVLETMLQAPVGLRQRSLLVRRMLANHQSVLANYPLEHGYPAAPLTVNNFWQFWPILPYYARGIARKIRSKVWRPHTPKLSDSLRLSLWQMEEVHQTLDYRRMGSTSVLDPTAVASFLRASQTPDFNREAEWNRLLSLEMALAQSRSQLQYPAPS
jgi:asparagine synthase (glutamine-hydrolysing)